MDHDNTKERSKDQRSLKSSDFFKNYLFHHDTKLMPVLTEASTHHPFSWQLGYHLQMA